MPGTRSSRLLKFFTDLFKGPDGETWAIGRVYSLPVLAVGLFLPVYAVARGQPLDLAEVGFLFGGVAAAAVALIKLTNDVDNPVPLPPGKTVTTTKTVTEVAPIPEETVKP